MSSFKGEGIFNSGPHRFEHGPIGTQTILQTALMKEIAGLSVLGAIERAIVVRGRLVAADAAGLAALVAAVEAQIDSPPKSGALVDNDGVSHADMSFVTFKRTGAPERGRAVTVGYEAVFVRLA